MAQARFTTNYFRNFQQQIFGGPVTILWRNALRISHNTQTWFFQNLKAGHFVCIISCCLQASGVPWPNPLSSIRVLRRLDPIQDSQSTRLARCWNWFHPWLFPAPSKDALQLWELPPEIISLYFNALTTDGITGFKMPMLSPRRHVSDYISIKSSLTKIWKMVVLNET